MTLEAAPRGHCAFGEALCFVVGSSRFILGESPFERNDDHSSSQEACVGDVAQHKSQVT